MLEASKQQEAPTKGLSSAALAADRSRLVIVLDAMVVHSSVDATLKSGLEAENQNLDDYNAVLRCCKEAVTEAQRRILSKIASECKKGSGFRRNADCRFARCCIRQGSL